MVDKSIFYETIDGVPPELEEQTHDLETLLDACKKYMQEWGVSPGNMINDICLILE